MCPIVPDKYEMLEQLTLEVASVLSMFAVTREPLSERDATMLLEMVDVLESTSTVGHCMRCALEDVGGDIAAVTATLHGVADGGSTGWEDIRVASKTFLSAYTTIQFHTPCGVFF